MYYVDGEYKGSYSNNEGLKALTGGEDNFGLDDYEPLFFHPLPEWVGYGELSVFLRFDDDTDYSKDIFYFCHVSFIVTPAITWSWNRLTICTNAPFTVIVDPSVHGWPHQTS